jgi:hypothetical protein
MCPITRTMFRDPVMLFDSGHTGLGFRV